MVSGESCLPGCRLLPACCDLTPLSPQVSREGDPARVPVPLPLLIRAPPPSDWDPSVGPHFISIKIKVLSPNTVTMRARASTYEFWGDTIRSITGGNVSCVILQLAWETLKVCSDGTDVPDGREPSAELWLEGATLESQWDHRELGLRKNMYVVMELWGLLCYCSTTHPILTNTGDCSPWYVYVPQFLPHDYPKVL